MCTLGGGDNILTANDFPYSLNQDNANAPD